MSTKPNYFKLGLFILMALFLLVLGIVLFGSGAFAKEKVFFESYFSDPVTGLAEGAPILEQGVKIGVVESISFVRNDYPLPEVMLSSSPYRRLVRVVGSLETGSFPHIQQDKETAQRRFDAFIKNGLRLQLSRNILTGQGIIEARYLDPERFPVGEYPWTPKYLFIPSARSDFTTMKDSVDKILQRLEQIETEKIGENMNKVLVSVNEAVNSARIGEVSQEALELVNELRQTNQDLKRLIENPGSQEGMANFAELIDQMNIILAHIDQLVFSESPQVIEILGNLKQMSENLKNMTENLEKTPSELIFSQPPERKGILK